MMAKRTMEEFKCIPAGKNVRVFKWPILCVKKTGGETGRSDG